MKSSGLRPRLAALLTAIGHISTSGSFIPGGSGIPTASSRPEGITSGPDGNLWFTEEGGGKIGRITTS